jgi:hypothetical protein
MRAVSVAGEHRGISFCVRKSLKVFKKGMLEHFRQWCRVSLYEQNAGILPLRQAQGQNDNRYSSIAIVKMLYKSGTSLHDVDFVVLVAPAIMCTPLGK